MAEGNSNLANDPGEDPLSLEEGITLIETGKADDGTRIDFGNGVVGAVSEEGGLDALLQRARGLRLIKMMAELKPVDRPAHMRKDKPALHPAVEEILDVLRPAD